MAPELIKADPRYKKQLLIRILIIAFIFAIGLAFFRSYLDSLIAGSDTQTLVLSLRIALWLMFSIPVLFGIYIFRLALRSYKEERFPPSGTKVIKDTILLTGKAAKSRAIIIILIACSLILISVGALFSATAIINML
jgi:hypothetical protein